MGLINIGVGLPDACVNPTASTVAGVFFIVIGGVSLALWKLVLWALDQALAPCRFAFRYTRKALAARSRHRRNQKALQRAQKAAAGKEPANVLAVGKHPVLPHELLLHISRDLHFADLVSANRSSKRLRTTLFGAGGLDPGHLDDLRRATCFAESKGGCELCGMQKCPVSVDPQGASPHAGMGCPNKVPAGLPSANGGSAVSGVQAHERLQTSLLPVLLRRVLPGVGQDSSPAPGKAQGAVCQRVQRAAGRLRAGGEGELRNRRRREEAVPDLRLAGARRTQEAVRGEGRKGARPRGRAESGLLSLQEGLLARGHDVVGLRAVLRGVPFAHAPGMGSWPSGKTIGPGRCLSRMWLEGQSSDCSRSGNGYSGVQIGVTFWL